MIGELLGRYGCSEPLPTGDAWRSAPNENLERALQRLTPFAPQPPRLLSKTFWRETGPQTLVTGVEWECEPSRLSEAAQALDPLFRRAPDPTVLAALYVIDKFVARRAMSQQDAQDDFEAWARRCRSLPGDVVISALKRWPETHRFWPTWVELRESMEADLSARFALVARLRELSRPRALPAPGEKRHTTPEERAEHIRKTFARHGWTWKGSQHAEA